MECHSAIKKNEILPFATTWMDLEGIMFSEMSVKDKYCMISLICGILKIQQTNEYNKKEADTEIESKLVVTSGERGGGAI